MKDYEKIDSFDPSVCLLGKIGRIHRVTSSIFRKYLSHFGVSNSQVSLLFILSKHSPLTQKQLAHIAKLEKSSLNRNLKRLIESGFVTRRDFPELNITEKGKNLVNAIIPEWEKAMLEIKSIIGKESEIAISSLHQKLTKE
jgi:DNA-binding MarR family transcriptional regulator